jgi:hypothetical protein
VWHREKRPRTTGDVVGVISLLGKRGTAYSLIM